MNSWVILQENLVKLDQVWFLFSSAGLKFCYVFGVFFLFFFA